MTTNPAIHRLLYCLFLLIPAVASAEAPYESMFNGDNLSGWAGNDGFWSVKDGVIVGQTTKENPTEGNTFLVWQGGQVGDFVFKTQVRFEGNNTGVQYRSELIDPEKFVVKGYQADLHESPEFFGMLYAEKWRGIVAKRFQRVVVGADGKPNVVGQVGDRDQPLVDSQWNELTIVAVGNRQIHQVNGITTMDLTDDHPEARREGILALQLHAGAPMKVEFKDIRIRHLANEDARTTINAAIQNQKKAPAKATRPKVGKTKAKAESALDWVSEAPSAHWIWRQDQPTANDPIYLRHQFKIGDSNESPSVKSARLYFTCDNGASVWINGKSAGRCSDWMYPVTMLDAEKLLQEGENQIAVKAANRGGTAAFVLKLEIETTDGKKHQIVSTPNWKLSDRETDGWQQSSFNDSDWNLAVIDKGKFDVGPWNKPGITSPDAGRGKGKVDSLSVDTIKVADGFKVELVYRVPKSEQGSWVSLTTDDQGRFYASDQGDAGLYRLTVTDAKQTAADAKPNVKVEKMPVNVSGAQGMVWHDGALYFNRASTPLYRLTDSTGDGLLDHADELTGSQGGGEHGNHAVIAYGDGKHLYVDAGNHTNLPDASQISGSRVPTWDEDLLLPREWDANGHARGRLAPGGWITKFDPETKTHEVVSIGYRNQYDITLNRAGDLFTYDADMEWDLGSPWYRPTRINHAVSGSDYGWRSGSGKWPEYYEDSLPAVLNIGPGSPTGVVSGQGTKFPAKYQDAIFALDWTFGTIYTIHLTPDGAGWRGQQETICHGSPLPVTDAIVGHDGNLYFTTGGRGTDSALFRIIYVGDESTQPVAGELAGEDARQLRRRLEKFHGHEDASAVAAAWPHLSSSDRWLRHAARIAIESQPVEQWAERVSTEPNRQARITATVALARSGNPSHQAALLAALLDLDLAELDDAQLLGLLRAYALTFIRLGEPNAGQREQVIAALDAHFPHANKDVNTELIRVLVYLNAPGVIEKTIQLMADADSAPPAWAANIDFTSNPRYGSGIQKMLANQPPSHEINYAFMLRNLRDGWTMDQLRSYIQFINKAAEFSGGNSYGKFLANLRDEVLGILNNDQRAQLADISGEDFNPVPDFKITAPQGPGKKWTQADASQHIGSKQLRAADFQSGRNLFHAAQCASCHRFDGLGGDVGPDLTTVKNKFDANYLLESIIQPSKVISDQYSSKAVLLADGRLLTGLVIDNGDTLDIYPPAKTSEELKPITVDADDIELIRESPISQMPQEMLDTLSGNEVRDLIAYLLSGGDPAAKVYGK
ncbi:Cytochrome c [Rubripirellula lacrimiformis]|uniref:Cytochrome c n=1 Tax=Rubripirellula lacrimiformis TaxID=1930273 RepID=A0A517NJP0_9BACT|nr:family 16 glycoside hydrolase [Rubripirellula lacrimiformis]QDT07340.1 Cytochrome c [Rubripirellula lacrimiformis]